MQSLLQTRPKTCLTGSNNLGNVSITDLNPPWSTTIGFQLMEAEPLGRGSFGRVFKARHRLDFIPYAIKQINVLAALSKLRSQNEEDESALLEKLLREIKLQSGINSSFVVRYHSHWVEGPGSEKFKTNKIRELLSLCMGNNRDESTEESSDDSDLWSSSKSYFSDSTKNSTFLYIQMELCNQETLKDFVKNATDRERLIECPRIISQTAKGLSAIHAKGIIHRDLKPDNIYATKGGGRNLVIWKIADFGISTKFGSSADELGGFNFDLSELDVTGSGKEEEFSSQSFKGTESYKSPEMYEQLPYTTKTDIYSLALIYIFTLCKFSSDFKCIEYFRYLRLQTHETSSIYEQDTILMDDVTRRKYFSVIQKMLCRNPDERPQALEIYTEVP